MKSRWSHISAARRNHDARVERDRISAEAEAANQIQAQTGATRSDALVTARRMLASKALVDAASTADGSGVTFAHTTESIDTGVEGDTVTETPRG